MIGDIQYRILEQEISYTGVELRSHFGLEKTGVYGSLLTGFCGPCRVDTKDLVDQEDRLNNDRIEAKSMFHIIGEFYGISLETGVLYQRLFISHLVEMLQSRGIANVKRSGDDVFVAGKKLTVSIATSSSNSVLIHWGINLDAAGAPVDAIGLYALGMDFGLVLEYTKKLLAGYCDEVRSIQLAIVKVRSV